MKNFLNLSTRVINALILITGIFACTSDNSIEENYGYQFPVPQDFIGLGSIPDCINTESFEDTLIHIMDIWNNWSLIVQEDYHCTKLEPVSIDDQLLVSSLEGKVQSTDERIVQEVINDVIHSSDVFTNTSVKVHLLEMDYIQNLYLEICPGYTHLFMSHKMVDHCRYAGGRSALAYFCAYTLVELRIKKLLSSEKCGDDSVGSEVRILNDNALFNDVGSQGIEAIKTVAHIIAVKMLSAIDTYDPLRGISICDPHGDRMIDYPFPIEMNSAHYACYFTHLSNIRFPII